MHLSPTAVVWLLSVLKRWLYFIDSLLSVAKIMGFFNCSMFCCALVCVHFSFAIVLMGKRELVALLCLSSWCLVIVVCLFLAVSRVCLQFEIVVILEYTHLLFISVYKYTSSRL